MTAAATESTGTFRMLSPDELALFFEEAAMFYGAGISMSEGIHIMAGAASGQGKAILEHIGRGLDEASLSLSGAMAAAGCFPAYAVNMVDIGEQTGKMDDVLASLGRYYRREDDIDRNLRSALTYPLVMVSMMAIVVVVLVTRVLPIFSRVFAQLGSEMTGFPKVAMDIGNFIGDYAYLFIGILFVFVAFIWVMRFARSDSKLVRSMRSVFFGGKKMTSKVDAGRFAAAMNLMMASGLDPESSLETLTRLMDDEAVREKVVNCREALMGGQSLADALVGAQLFDSSLAMLLPLGFRTGNLENVMRHIADRCEAEVDARIDRAIGIIEPTLVAVLSIVVGAILLSTMLPLLGIMTSIG